MNNPHQKTLKTVDEVWIASASASIMPNNDETGDRGETLLAKTRTGLQQRTNEGLLPMKAKQLDANSDGIVNRVPLETRVRLVGW